MHARDFSKYYSYSPTDTDVYACFDARKRNHVNESHDEPSQQDGLQLTHAKTSENRKSWKTLITLGSGFKIPKSMHVLRSHAMELHKLHIIQKQIPCTAHIVRQYCFALFTLSLSLFLYSPSSAHACSKLKFIKININYRKKDHLNEIQPKFIDEQKSLLLSFSFSTFVCLQHVL